MQANGPAYEQLGLRDFLQRVVKLHSLACGNTFSVATACDFENISDFIVDLDGRKHEPRAQDLVGTESKT